MHLVFIVSIFFLLLFQRSIFTLSQKLKLYKIATQIAFYILIGIEILHFIENEEEFSFNKSSIKLFFLLKIKRQGGTIILG